MSTTTGVKTVTATAAAAAGPSVTWQMWVPCLAMAACSWLSFFHRTILAALAPPISCGEKTKARNTPPLPRSEEHTSELQSREKIVCRLLLEKKKKHIRKS